jgi:hypothetical protein
MESRSLFEELSSHYVMMVEGFEGVVGDEDAGNGSWRTEVAPKLESKFEFGRQELIASRVCKYHPLFGYLSLT